MAYCDSERASYTREITPVQARPSYSVTGPKHERSRDVDRQGAPREIGFPAVRKGPVHEVAAGGTHEAPDQHSEHVAEGHLGTPPSHTDNVNVIERHQEAGQQLAGFRQEALDTFRLVHDDERDRRVLGQQVGTMQPS
jgi:hypothetical protein